MAVPDRRAVGHRPAPAPAPVVVVVRDSDPEAADALALGDRLAATWDAGLVVVPVVLGRRPPDAANARARRLQVAQVRVWVHQQVPARAAEVVPVIGPSAQADIHALAADCGAGLLIVPSARHSPEGRVYLGSWEASSVVHNAPCPVAVAPAGYRHRAPAEPPVVGVAFDGEPESLPPLRSAHALARDLGATLRVIAVEPSADGHDPAALAGADALDLGGSDGTRRLAGPVAALGDAVPVELVELHGDPVAQLAEISAELDLLVCGSRGRRPLRRLALGRLPLMLMRSAACPLVVVAPGAPILAAGRAGA